MGQTAVPGGCFRSGRASRPTWWTVLGQCGQATKGIRWMTWCAEAKKGRRSLRNAPGAGKRALSGDVRMWQTHLRPPECIGWCERTQETETSHYLEEQKEKSIPSVVASERGRSPKPGVTRVAGLNMGAAVLTERFLEKAGQEGDSP